MKTKKNIISIMIVLISATIFLSGVNASDNDAKKKPEVKTMAMINADYPDLKVVELGFHYMPTFYSMDFHSESGDIVRGSVTLAHGFGGMLALNFSPHVGVQAEIDYYKATQKYKDQSVNNKVDIKYLNIPVLLSLNTNKMARINLNAVVGPQFGINVGSDISSSGSTGTATATLDAKKGDIGAAFGAGLEFALDQGHNIRLDLGYRGFYGFVKMDADKTGDDTYNVMVSANRKTNAAYVRLTFLF
jgi:opacity protein-like surface antigen